jgi:hypothetical protein
VDLGKEAVPADIESESLVLNRPSQPTDLTVLIEDNDRHTLLGQLQSCRQACWTGADD